MRFHVLAVPHTVTHKDYSACAFTQKVLKFCNMMHDRGHEIYHYGHERSTVRCKEKITCMTDEILKKSYGDHDWRTHMFKHDANDIAHWYFNMKASEEITPRKRPGDYLLLFWGIGHAHVAKVHNNDMIVVEPGIGSYNNVIAPFSVFESYAVMHHVYAKHNLMPRFMDSVIPNYFDPNDFIDASNGYKTDAEYTELYTSMKASEESSLAVDATSKPNVDTNPNVDTKSADTKATTLSTITIKDVEAHLGKVCSLETALSVPAGTYVLVIGRMILSKGVQVAIEVCKAAKIKLILAGQGSIESAVSKEFFQKGIDETDIKDPLGVTHVGYIDPAVRAVLIARSKCVMMPTLYAEPFGGVNVEAQMAGIPVITTDWGAFAETVDHGRSGYRCRTMDHFIWALKNVDFLNKKAIRKHALQTWGLTKVSSMYEEYFQMLGSAFKGKGYYEENKGRLALKWLEKPAFES